MIDTINFNGDTYPAFQAKGNAAQFAIPYALHICKGKGYDIGCMKKEWAFPGAIPIDIDFPDPWHANNLPEQNVDYIFSSHCLEHVHHWINTLDYWINSIKFGGTIFLYLPDFSQKYWRPWNNRKHHHVLAPEILIAYFSEHKNIGRFFCSQIDLNSSFMIYGEKIGIN